MMKIAIKTVLTLLVAWGFTGLVWLTADWMTSAMPGGGYWPAMAATGAMVAEAAVATVLVVAIWLIRS